MPLNTLQLSLQFAKFADAATHRAALPRHQVARWIRHALDSDAEITVRIVDAEEGRALNRDYRHKDYATNVLTFDYAQEPQVMADLVLCAPVVAEEARKLGLSLADHYAHLLVHASLHAQGWEVAASYCEKDLADTARDIIREAGRNHCELLLPIDIIVSERAEPGAAARERGLGELDEHERILDAGPQTVARLKQAMDASKTLIWNGPLGVFEIPPFDKATMETAQHAAKLCREGSLVAVGGGGDTVSALNAAGVAGDFTFVSTAGGAFLEWMEGKTLPGVAALMR